MRFVSEALFVRVLFCPRGESSGAPSRDISKNGAMICVQSILGLPDRFELERDGITRQVKVMRREPTRLAVKFL